MTIRERFVDWWLSHIWWRFVGTKVSDVPDEFLDEIDAADIHWGRLRLHHGTARFGTPKPLDVREPTEDEK